MFFENFGKHFRFSQKTEKKVYMFVEKFGKKNQKLYFFPVFLIIRFFIILIFQEPNYANSVWN